MERLKELDFSDLEKGDSEGTKQTSKSKKGHQQEEGAQHVTEVHCNMYHREGQD